MSTSLPMTSVRGRVRNWINKHASKLGNDVLEIGSRIHVPEAWWVSNRDLAQGSWIGMDVQPGMNVDVVADVQHMPEEWSERFTGVLCSEVLEHISRPWIAIPQMLRVLQHGGWLVVTTLFAFPEHGYPSDFYRYTRNGLALLLTDAGFVDVVTAYCDTVGVIHLTLDDHGEGAINERSIPMHVYAIARRP